MKSKFGSLITGVSSVGATRRGRFASRFPHLTSRPGRRGPGGRQGGLIVATYLKNMKYYIKLIVKTDGSGPDTRRARACGGTGVGDTDDQSGVPGPFIAGPGADTGGETTGG